MTTRTITQRTNMYVLRPTNFNEALQFAELIAKSDFVPRDYKEKPGNVLVAIQMGSELGLAPMQALQNIAVINGRPTVWGDAMLALVTAHKDCVDIQEINDDEKASCTIKRRGRSPITRTFTIAEAKHAGLADKQGPWKQYPKRMLQMRARAFALRDAFPDALKGLNMTEEVMDYDESPTTMTFTYVNGHEPQDEQAYELLNESPTQSQPNYLELIQQAQTCDGLQKLGAEIKIADLEPALRDELRLAYTKRWQELSIPKTQKVSAKLKSRLRVNTLATELP